MTIYTFIDQYCKDLVEKNKVSKTLMALEGLPRDDVIEDDEGNVIPVVIVDGNNIPVSDFLTMDKHDFLKVWTSPGAEEALDNYISALTILEGEEALNKIRNAVRAETERLKHDVELVTSI